MNVSEGMKVELFRKMAELEEKSLKTGTRRDFNRANGAFEMLTAVGLGCEFALWSSEQEEKARR